LTVDLAVLALLVLLSVAGALTGALRQGLTLAAALLGWLAARHLAAPVGRGLARTLPEAAARPVAAVLLFLGTYALVSIVGGLVLRSRAAAGAVRSPADRALGALLGGAKATLVVWVLLSAAALAGGPVGPRSFRVDPRTSDFAAVARDHNLLARVDPRRAKDLERVLRAIRDPKAFRRLEADPEARALLADPRLRSLAGPDPGAPGTAEERVARDPAVRALVERLLEREAALDAAGR
jgi:membrane protein required for colicin V production